MNFLLIYNLPDVSNQWRLDALLSVLAGSIYSCPQEGSPIMILTENPQDNCTSPSHQNLLDFYPHTDLSYVNNPPDIIAMHTIYNNNNEYGSSIFCDVSKMVSMLSTKAKEELQKPNFIFIPPEHYTGNPKLQGFPILTWQETTLSWNIRFRKDKLKFLNEKDVSIEYIDELLNAIDCNTFFLKPPENSFYFINNRTILHGRTGYKKQIVKYINSKNRLVNRIYINACTE